MSEVIPVLRRELSVLDEDVAKLRGELDRVQGRLKLAAEKAERIRALVQLYNGEPNEPDQQGLFTGTEIDGVDKHVRTRVRPDHGDQLVNGHGSKRLRVKQAAIELIQPKGSAHRNDILQTLIERGIMGHEKSPMASLAAYLSEFRDIFEADGRGNFSLRAQTSHEPPPAGEKPAGSVEAAHPGEHPEHAFSPQIVQDERQVVHDNMN